jgi:hypothetical protein
MIDNVVSPPMMQPLFDVIGILLGFVNLQAALLGVAASQAFAYILPAKEGGDTFSTQAGTVGARLQPFVAPFVACVATFFLEWDKAFTAPDAVRGFLSGFASEYFLRVYYKTIRGL